MFFHYAHDMENVVPYAEVSLYVFIDWRVMLECWSDYKILFHFLKFVEYLCSNMFRQEYEERLLRQLSIKEGRPFQAALPLSAGFSGSSSAVDQT
jgi:hypothetical protein